MTTNDNDLAAAGTTPAIGDAHGRAALLLVESLIHELCGISVLSARQAVEITERAISVQFDQARAADGAGAPMWRSHALLRAISTSLGTDDQDGPRLV